MTSGAPLLRQRDFSLYLLMSVARAAGSQMVAVGVGWQVYSLHHKPFDLGLVGLAEFVPIPLLALPSGQLADRVSRRLAVAVSTTLLIAASSGLLAVTLSGARALWPFLALAVISGASNSIGLPAARALPPELVPPPDLPAAFAVRSTAVLFGGAVALLPVFASSILHTGPTGLGILRSAPSIGAMVAGVMLTWRPLSACVGPAMLGTVALFGASTIVFGLSKSFALSAVALAVSGFADLVSVNIRSTAVALATPDGLRGRVNAVEAVFISASNQLGAFESGMAAALIGTVPAVVAGGAITIALATLWVRAFPSLARLGRFDELRPETVPP